MLIFHLFVAAALAIQPAEFEVHTLDGESAVGQLLALDGRKLVLETNAGQETFELARLAALAHASAAAEARSAPALWIELVDDSRLAASQFTVDSGTAAVQAAFGPTFEFPVRLIRWVRFVTGPQQDSELAKQWDEITAVKAAGDLLVVRKGDALDYLEGVLRAIDADVCQFELDGEVLSVKRPKIEGLVYARVREVDLPEAIGTLITTDGGRVQMQAVELIDERLKLITPAGTSHVVPLVDVVRFDFSAGKIAYLSDLEPDRAVFTPLVGWAQPPPGLLDFYQYRRDAGFDQSPLRLDGKVFRKGLALSSRTELAYKLPGKFRLFRATVGIDDSTRETGSVHLRIEGDGRTLWEGEVRGSEPAHALELEIEGVKRLEVVADYGEGLDVGDRLILGDAQVRK